LPKFEESLLFSVAPLVLTFYYKLLKRKQSLGINTYDPLLAPLQQILVNPTFRQICLTHTEELYSHLAKLNEQTVVGEILNIVLFGKTEITFNRDNIATLGAQTVMKILSSTNKWTLRNNWLELRLLLDQWSGITASPTEAAQQLVLLLLGQLVQNPDSSSTYSKLVSSLGSSVQIQLLQQVQQFLESKDLLAGTVTLKEQLQTLVNIQGPGDTRYSSLEQALVDLVVPCLLSSPETQKHAFAISLLSQLEGMCSINSYGYDGMSIDLPKVVSLFLFVTALDIPSARINNAAQSSCTSYTNNQELQERLQI